MRLRRFQKRFLFGALSEGVRTAALSIPRGNGKTTLAALLAYRILNPLSSLFRAGTESHLIAASLGQSRRTSFRALKQIVESRPDCEAFRISENRNECSITHLPTDTRVSVLAPKSATAQGLVNCPWVISDEPGAWETIGGEAMYTAIQTAQGKPGSPLRSLFLGTLAPGKGQWWLDLVKQGSSETRFVTSLAADPKRWDALSEVKRVNPLIWKFPESRKVLLDEFEEAKRDEPSKARFMSFRLNIPTRLETDVLLTVAEWMRVIARPVAAREGLPVVGIDLGGGRAWSAAVALWPSGRCEAVAVAPGIPDIASQEKRDLVQPGTYQRLVDAGVLFLADGLRVPKVSTLVELAFDSWGAPAGFSCDRFRLHELQDATGGRWPVEPRVARWSEASADIRELRRLALDGNLSVDERSRPLLAWSIASAAVENDDSGNCRMIKRGSNNLGRDDVAAALVLAAGSLARHGSMEPAKVFSF